MIPKIIHYCWFGRNPLTPLAVKCIQSWKNFCPDYKFIEWNEDNFDVNICDYVKEAYDSKKWAFVSDYVRLYALVNYGGIYMDTDVEIIRPIDKLLQFRAVSGFESYNGIPTGFMSCEKGHKMFAEFLDEYKSIHFIKDDGSLDTTTNVTRITRICTKYGLQRNNQMQTINGFTLLPKDYLCPGASRTGTINITNNTYTIHYFAGSWLDEETRYQYTIMHKLYRAYIPKRIAFHIGKICAITKYRGMIQALKYLPNKVITKIMRL